MDSGSRHMRMPGEQQYLDVEAALKSQLQKADREVQTHEEFFLRSLGCAGVDMSVLVQPEIVAKLQDAAEPLYDQPMAVRSFAIGYYKGYDKPGQLIPNARRTESNGMPFRGAFRGLEVVYGTGPDAGMSSLCLVLKSFSTGRPGRYGYSNRNYVGRGQTRITEPDSGLAWVPAAPITSLEVMSRHTKHVVDALDEVRSGLSEMYRPQPRPQ